MVARSSSWTFMLRSSGCRTFVGRTVNSNASSTADDLARRPCDVDPRRPRPVDGPDAPAKLELGDCPDSLASGRAAQAAWPMTGRAPRARPRQPSHPERAQASLALDADERLEPRDRARKAGAVGRVDDVGHVLVGARRVLGDPARRGAANQDAASGKLVDDLATVPAARRLIAAHAPPGAVAGRAECGL